MDQPQWSTLGQERVYTIYIISRGHSSTSDVRDLPPGPHHALHLDLHHLPSVLSINPPVLPIMLVIALAIVLAIVLPRALRSLRTMRWWRTKTLDLLDAHGEMLDCGGPRRTSRTMADRTNLGDIWDLVNGGS